MRVSILWLGVILISIVTIGILWKGKGVYEAFTTEPEKLEGFQADAASLDDLNVNTCPANSNQFVDSNGLVLCCKGDLVDGQCSTNPICSLSEGTNKYPTCSIWTAAYLNEKGRNRCPPSLPNYYETKDETVRGCTDGRRNKTGSAPLTQKQRFCKLYRTQQEEEGKIDSCENQKLLEQSVCFKNTDVKVEKTLISVLNGFLPAQVQCNFGDINTRTAGTCITNDSMDRFMTRIFEILGIRNNDWKSGTVNWDPIEKMNFCSVAEKYKIRKTITFKDLPTVRVFD